MAKAEWAWNAAAPVTFTDGVFTWNVGHFVGEYHLHATLRDAQDVQNAWMYPTGPSPEDDRLAGSSLGDSGAPRGSS